MTQDNRDYMIRTSTGLVPGLTLAGLGVLFLLSNLDILQVYNWWQLWPVVVIAIGVTKLVDSPVIGEKTAGTVMIGVGGIFLATTFGWVPWDVLDFWPLALIGLGLVMLFQRLGDLEENSRWRYAARSQHADGIAVFGGFQRRVTTDDYGGADYVTIFGGARDRPAGRGHPGRRRRRQHHRHFRRCRNQGAGALAGRQRSRGYLRRH